MNTGATATTVPTTSDPRRWKGLGILTLSLLIVVMDMSILNVALIELSRDLAPSSVQLLWMMDIYALVVAALLVTVSGIGDRWGRRRMLIAGYAIFAVASAMVLAVSDPWAMVAMRALLGVGGAMIMPSTLSMIRGLFPNPSERAQALGVWGATAGIGGSIGPLVGGALLIAFPWQSVFLINVPVMAIGIVLGLRFLPETRSPKPAPLDWPATGAAGIGLVALLYGIKNLSKDGLTPITVPAAGIAVVALGIFAWRSLTRRDPMIDLRLFRSGAFSAGISSALWATFAMMGLLLLGAQWLQVVHGLTPLQAGLAMLPAGIGGTIASMFAPWLAPRVGARNVLGGGLSITAVGMAILWLAQPLSLPAMLVVFFLIGVSSGSLALGSAVIMASTPVERAGNAAALEEVSYEVGGALGLAVLGSVAAASYRRALPAEAAAGLPAEAADAVNDSVLGAAEVAARLGGDGATLLQLARDAFTESLATVGLVGAAIMLIVAVVVWRLTPRSLDVTVGHD